MWPEAAATLQLPCGSPLLSLSPPFRHLPYATMRLGSPTAAALLAALVALAAGALASASAPTLGPSHRQLQQLGSVMPMRRFFGGQGGGFGGSAYGSTGCDQALGALPGAQASIQQAVSKGFVECILQPCLPEAAGLAPVGCLGLGFLAVKGNAA